MLKLLGKPVAEHIDKITKSKISNKKVVISILKDIGNNSSDAYLRSLIRKAKELGITLNIIENEFSTGTLINEISLENVSDINGLLILQPMSANINIGLALSQINPKLDIDGTSKQNIANIYTDTPPYFLPATADAVMHLLDYYDFSYEGKNAVVIGRSNVVGKPLTQELLKRDATVTICHSKTKNLEKHTKNADLVISCVGVQNLLNANAFNKNAWVIDVGTTYTPDGKVHGDINKDDLDVYAYTPVPGGVGVVTTSVLFAHALKN